MQSRSSILDKTHWAVVSYHKGKKNIKLWGKVGQLTLISHQKTSGLLIFKNMTTQEWSEVSHVQSHCKSNHWKQRLSCPQIAQMLSHQCCQVWGSLLSTICIQGMGLSKRHTVRLKWAFIDKPFPVQRFNAAPVWPRKQKTIHIHTLTQFFTEQIVWKMYLNMLTKNV